MQNNKRDTHKHNTNQIAFEMRVDISRLSQLRFTKKNYQDQIKSIELIKQSIYTMGIINSQANSFDLIKVDKSVSAR